MAKNTNLKDAKKAKKDEFYTQYEDIQNELAHYKKHFYGKVVLCNCDDPKISNFFKYFAHNYYDLGLEKLICTCYKNASGEEFRYELENQDKIEGLKDPKPDTSGDKSCFFIYDGEDKTGKEKKKLIENKQIDEFIATKIPIQELKNDKAYLKEKNTNGGGVS